MISVFHHQLKGIPIFQVHMMKSHPPPPEMPLAGRFEKLKQKEHISVFPLAPLHITRGPHRLLPGHPLLGTGRPRKERSLEVTFRLTAGPLLASGGAPPIGLSDVSGGTFGA